MRGSVSDRDGVVLTQMVLGAHKISMLNRPSANLALIFGTRLLWHSNHKLLCLIHLTDQLVPDVRCQISSP